MAVDLFSCMRSFVAVAECHGFAMAARKLHISPPVLTKQIQWLEHRLKKTLLERTTRHMSLTEAGQVYLIQARQVLEGLVQAEAALEGLETEPHGAIVLGDGGFVNTPTLVKYLHLFLQRYPKISIQLRAENSPALVLDGTLDFIISQDSLSDTGLIKEHLFTVSRNIYAAPSYLEAHGVPKTIADLKHHECLIFQKTSPNGEWLLSKKTKVKVQGRYSSESSRHFLLALLEGFGLGWCADYLVEEYVAAGRLQKIVLDNNPIKMPVFLYYRPSSHNLAVKYLAAHLQKIASQHHFYGGMASK